MFEIKDNPNIEAAVAMVIAASMQDKPLHIARIESHCDADVPEELEYVLKEAAFYGVDVQTD